jgi:hypothetical protein
VVAAALLAGFVAALAAALGWVLPTVAFGAFAAGSSQPSKVRLVSSGSTVIMFRVMVRMGTT